MSEGATTLTEEEVKARINGLDLSQEGDKYKFFKPTSEAVDKWVQYAKGSHDCFYLGLQDIDSKMRGIWPSDVLVVTGRAHSGKSAVLLSSIARNLQENPDFYGVIYTPDEPEILVVSKLYALLFKRNLAEVEEALRIEDRDVVSEINEARDGFLDRVKIFPSAMTFEDMSEAMSECEDYWQSKPGFVMVDFLEQLPKASGYEGVSNVLKGLKEWAEHQNLPVGLVHQSGKSSQRGTSNGMNSGKFNADEYAIQQLNVFRKREDPKLSDEERRIHSVSVSLDLCKNKRPPCQITSPPVDYYMDPACGFVREYYESDIPEDERWLE
jgi:replicative DNA helicase|tara:strand:+ start:8494 stop:9468 length:975 start_codon:yes stop_codon:yes gene_type:complete